LWINIQENIDLTTIIRQEAIFLGWFGDKYQKMGIAFLTIKKINDTQYEVTGKSQLDKVCNFSGILDVEFSKEDRYAYSYFQGEEEIFSEDISGKATGKYLFEEDRSQTETGIFEGTFEIEWNKGDNFRTLFTNIYNKESSIIIGAAFTGTWKSHRTGTVFKAGWGNINPTSIPVIHWSNQHDWWIVNEEYRTSGWALEIDQDKYLIEDYLTEDYSTAEERLKAHPDYRKWHEWWK
jgi:hypothetical protein